MHKAKLIWFVALTMLLFSCKEKKGDSDQSSAQSPSDQILVRKDSGDFIIQLDEFSTWDFKTLRYYEDHTAEYLFTLNPANNSIHKYNLKGGTVVANYPFEYDGPNGVGKLDGFDLIGKDSLVLLAAYEYKLSLSNIPSGEDKPSVRSFKLYNQQDFDGFEMTTFARTSSPIFKFGNDVYMASIPFVDGIKDTYFANGKSMTIYNVKSNSVSFENQYSELYDDGWSNAYGHMSYTYNPIKEHFVVSMPADHNLQTVSLNGSKETVELKPKTVYEIDPFRPKVLDNESNNLHMWTNPRYENILYDKYRDVYYRIVSMPNERGRQTKDERYYPRKETIVIVLNSDLEIIGEQNLGTYYIRNQCFVGKNGLYFAQPIIEETNQMAEDKLKYVCFEFSTSNEKE